METTASTVVHEQVEVKFCDVPGLHLCSRPVSMDDPDKSFLHGVLIGLGWSICEMLTRACRDECSFDDGQLLLPCLL